MVLARKPRRGKKDTHEMIVSSEGKQRMSEDVIRGETMAFYKFLKRSKIYESF